MLFQKKDKGVLQSEQENYVYARMDENLNMSNLRVLCLQGFCAGSNIPELYSTVSRSRCKQCSFTTKTTAGYINQEHILRNHIIKQIPQITSKCSSTLRHRTAHIMNGHRKKQYTPSIAKKECNSSFESWQAFVQIQS